MSERAELQLARGLSATSRIAGGRRAAPSVTVLVGMGNSGKTLLRRLLRRGVDGVAVFPYEMNELWLPGLYPWSQAQIELPPVWADPCRVDRALLDMPGSSGAAERIRWTLSAFARARRSPLVLHDNGNLSLLPDRLDQVLPQRDTVAMVRDPRVVAHLAAKRQMEKIAAAPARYERFGLAWDYERLVRHFAHLWRSSWNHFATRAPGRTLLVRYEDLCSDPRSTVEDVASFLGVERRKLRDGSLPSLYDTNSSESEDLAALHEQAIVGAVGSAFTAAGYE